MSGTIAIAPLPHHYAVIRMDPVSMAIDLGLDEVAVAEAEALAKETKKYLVYMFQPAELPLPTSRWCRYDVKPIGTTLRPADESRGITPDMVIPIADNTHYTGEREPVRPTPSFPFHNCYHWIKNDMTVRVRVHKGGVDHTGAISLSLVEDFALNKGFRADYKRIRAFLREKRSAAAKAPQPPSGDSSARTSSVGASSSAPSGSGAEPRHGDDLDSLRPEELAETYVRMAEERGVTTSTPPESHAAASSARSTRASGSSASTSDSESSSSSLPSSVLSIDSLASEDLFGWDPDPAQGLLPLVDAWLDIANHFSEAEIPSPVGLEDEVRAIRLIIKRGVARRALAEKASAAAQIPQDSTGVNVAKPQRGHRFRDRVPSSSPSLSHRLRLTLTRGLRPLVQAIRSR